MQSKLYLFGLSTFIFTMLFLRECRLLTNIIQLFQVSIWYFVTLCVFDVLHWHVERSFQVIYHDLEKWRLEDFLHLFLI